MDIPGYKIIDRLGQGGMATVYLAIQESFEREVALKVLSPELLRDPAFGDRFLREAKIVSRLVHPNIVTVYDVGVQNGHHYLSMEYVPGQDLKQLRTKLTRAQGLQVVKDIARALDYAARKGYVHRDVKPENIMLHEEDGRAVLMDFGIARPTGVESGMTQTGTAIGTPHYMSPEQAKGRAVDSRSDIYSLGVVLFQLICGRVPFDADSAVAVGIKHVAEPIPRLPAAFGVFQSIIDHVLAKNPDQRYQTGAELVEDLEQIDDDDLRRVDELIDLAAQRLTPADVDAPTVISSAMNTHEINAAQEQEDDADAFAQHWPQAGQGESLAQTERSGGSNPFGASSGFRWLRNSLLLLLLMAGLAFALRNQLPAPWPERITLVHHQSLDWLKAQALPLSEQQWRWLYELGGAVKVSEIPDKVSPAPSANTLESQPASKPASTPNPAATEDETINTSPSRADDVLADTRPVLSAEGVIAQPEPGAGPVADATAVGGSSEQALQKAMVDDLAHAADLADFYAALRQTDAQQPALARGLAWVEKFFRQALSEAEAKGDSARIRALLASARAHFPEQLDQALADRSESYVKREATIAGLLELAQEQLARDALSAPAGDNALESFQKVLNLSPDNRAALGGLTAVADRYQALASNKLRAEDLRNAKALANRGLSIAPDHSGLNKLQAEIDRRTQAERRREQQVQQLKARAEQQLSAGNIYGAEGAVAQYLAILALAPNQAGVQAALDRQIARTRAQVREFIEQKRFDRAQQSFDQALQLLAGHRVIEGLQTELQQAIAQAKPRIDLVRVGGQPTVQFSERQKIIQGADRTLYIGVKFHNFDETAVVQAILLDGARTIQIAQVPVVLSGATGEKTFRIDRPVEGFSAGGYNLDLMLENQLLVSQHFQIGNL